MKYPKPTNYRNNITPPLTILLDKHNNYTTNTWLGDQPKEGGYLISIEETRYLQLHADGTPGPILEPHELANPNITPAIHAKLNITGPTEPWGGIGEDTLQLAYVLTATQTLIRGLPNPINPGTPWSPTKHWTNWVPTTKIHTQPAQKSSTPSAK